MALRETRTITEMHPNHWHAMVASQAWDGEWDVGDEIWQYHAEALAAHGRENPYYVYDCEDLDCQDGLDLDDDWRLPEACARRWGRND